MNTPSVEAALKDPAAHFASPRDVLADRVLSRDDKRKVLEAWVKDAQLIAKADEENMTGGEPARLGEAKIALGELDKLPPHDP